MSFTSAKKRRKEEHSIAIVNYDGAQLAAVYGLCDMLATSTRSLKLDSKLSVYRLDDVLKQPSKPYTAIILPPSLRDEPPSVSPTLGQWILDAHAEGSILCSVCVSAFFLAELGLLSGRPATTHWAFKDLFVETFSGCFA